MKNVAFSVAGLLLASAAFAQSAPPPGSGLPPPGLHDPGVKPAPAATARAAAMPALPSMRSDAPAAAAPAEPLPDVRVRREGDDTIQEYRRNGQVYMVVITPKGGVPQTYMVDPQGRMVDEHGKKPVGPVMYKVMEWGKSRPAEASSSGD
ncbi:DUF2782 domain-containing protein [Fulvimonas soli]|jgi:hypothetical protein|uniref:Uncharacterized protein DUF2782 n=1 Tax=Fulvimonas soli TaxID=155197 RepID=A0A316I8E8_9GAMM|nr:DUF2782 domain-containing protein [Fulvimonas soli]PWK86678.1 uncharacterized protein DUF2782 [Fulvimonas soli]TNY26220.1 hypothetical protein BV497_09875 [Fulvimonas soli]